MFLRILKFNPHHDAMGRFASGGLYNAEFTETDRTIIDLKPDRRPLTKPEQLRTLRSFIAGAQHIPYTKLPFFDAMMKMQGTDMAHHSGAEQKAARDALLKQQPTETISIRDLTFTQNVVNWEATKNFKTVNPKPVQVARYNGKLYLLDGHHRVAYEAAFGKHDSLEAYVLDLSKVKVSKWASAELLRILKYNLYHDELGRFASAERSADPHVVDGTYLSREQEKAIERRFCATNPKTVAQMEKLAVGNNEMLQRNGEDIERMMPGVKLFMGPIKQNLQNKIDRKGYPDASHLTDVVRCTFAVKNLDDVPKLIKELGKRFPTLDQGFKSPGLSYVDGKALIRFPNGMVGEVQILEPNMWQAKMSGFPEKNMRPGHIVYEIDRNLSKADRSNGKGYDDYMESFAIYSHATSLMPEDWQNLIRRGHKMLRKEDSAKRSA